MIMIIIIIIIIIIITNGLLSQFIVFNRPVSLRLKINFQFFALKGKEKQSKEAIIN